MVKHPKRRAEQGRSGEGKSAEFEASLAKEEAQKMRLAAEVERDSSISAMKVLEEAK